MYIIVQVLNSRNGGGGWGRVAPFIDKYQIAQHVYNWGSLHDVKIEKREVIVMFSPLKLLYNAFSQGKTGW